METQQLGIKEKNGLVDMDNYTSQSCNFSFI